MNTYENKVDRLDAASIVFQHPDFPNPGREWAHIMIVGVGGYGQTGAKGKYESSIDFKDRPEAANTAALVADFWIRQAINQHTIAPNDQPIGTVALCITNADGKEYEYQRSKRSRKLMSKNNHHVTSKAIVRRATRTDVSEAFRHWDDRLKSLDTTAVLHWIGHGRALGDQENPRDQLLILENTKYPDDPLRKFQDAFSIVTLCRYMRDYTGSEKQLFFIDACNSNPVPNELRERYSPILVALNSKTDSSPIQWAFHAASRGNKTYANGRRTGFSVAVLEAGLWFAGEDPDKKGSSWAMTSDGKLEECIKHSMQRWIWENGIEPVPTSECEGRNVKIWRGIHVDGGSKLAPLRSITSPRSPLMIVTNLEKLKGQYSLSFPKQSLRPRRLHQRNGEEKTNLPVIYCSVPSNSNKLTFKLGAEQREISIDSRPKTRWLIPDGGE